MRTLAACTCPNAKTPGKQALEPFNGQGSPGGVPLRTCHHALGGPPGTVLGTLCATHRPALGLRDPAPRITRTPQPRPPLRSRPPVGLQAGVVPDAIAGGPELVGREQAHDRGQVAGLGPAQDDRGLTYVQRGQRIHPTSVPETSDCPAIRACGARIRRGA